MLHFFVLVFLGSARQYSIELKSQQTQQHLIELVNLLQHSHAQLLELQHYERIGQDLQGLLKFETVFLEKQINKKHLKHQKHHNKKEGKHKKRQHQYMIVNEALMDVIPLTHEEKDVFQNSGSLVPIDFGIEQQMEHQSQKLLSTERISNGAYIADVPLTNIANTMFIGKLQIGSAKGKNTFDVIFDTGSALTCIASEQCKDIGCQKSKRYNRVESKSFNEIGKQVEIVFGSGTLKGLINREQINVDGLNLKDALFIEVTQQIGDAFHEGEFDGIVGLGYPHMTGVPTLFDYMMKQHKLHQNIFTFHLNRATGNSGSQLIFGGSDDSQIKGQWVYHNVHEQFYWSIMAEEIRVGNKNTGICSQQHKCKMVIDTGTTLLTGPTKEVRTLLSMIRVEPKCQNFQTMPDITFVIDGNNYVLQPKDYILTITQAGVEPPYQHSSMDQIVGCAGTIFPLDLPPKQGPLWILGDVFITKYSAKFDREKNRVGLALNKNVQK
ncbi:unnamed protein product [Paramecium pentaurelia]|uniref:Peptidase A1 domain-containing protein n=1 Tax=Paramecium pentaurelia TaxID=43138 RepID=A0A8S1WUD9_9CILI|nr:unnamed protein product [Paramecium pentaurelia]